MKKLMHILFLSCYKATELIERKLHTELSFKEQLRLRIHLMMCNACSTYEKQSYILEKGIQQLKPGNEINVDFKELKNRINNKLKEQL